MAAVTNTFAQWSNSSDANFRIWGSGFSAQLLAAGLVQTSDTGQIDWLTVTAPATASANWAGYEIWRFNDTLQATAPVYFKIEYGNGTNSNSPSIRFQIGSGSNGSGSLMGSLSTLAIAMGAFNAGTVTNYWSGSTGRFVACIGTGVNTNTPLIWGVERSKNASGNDTSEAVLVVYKQTTSGGAASAFAQFAWDVATGMKTLIETSSLSILMPTQGTGVTGTQIATYPILHTKGVFMNPGMNFMGYFTADITALSTPSIPIYGTNHTYLAVGGSNIITVVTRASTANNSLLMRYE